MSSAETEIAGVRVHHGIYHIVVVSPGRFTDERLTDREYVTITPPGVKPDTNQLVIRRLYDEPRLSIAHQAVFYSVASPQ